MDDEQTLIDDAKVLGALAHPMRLRLLTELATPQTATDLIRKLDGRHSTIQHHLRELKWSALIEGRKGGRDIILSRTPWGREAVARAVAFLIDAPDCEGCEKEPRRAEVER